MFYDKLRPLDENPLCPQCASRMNFTSRSRSEEGTYDALRYECPICHMRQKITTRNNVRVDSVLMTSILLGYVGLFIFIIWMLIRR